MKTMLLVLTMMAAVVRPQPTDSSESDDLEQWELFKMEYGKEYGSQKEQDERKSIFMKSLVFVREHNTKYERGESTFNVKINRFADWTAEELAPMINCFKRKENRFPSGEFFQEPSDLELPPSVDWREKGAVTPVKNQGDCGSCWAFSSTGSLEGQTFLKTSKLVSLSEQNLIDCSTSQGNQGCKGGDMDWSFQYVKVNNGIDTEESYPYEAKEYSCRYDPKNKGATDSGFVDIPSGSEDKLQAAIATVGPISVAIDANHISFALYSSGVYYEPECSPALQSLDHAVLAVGYGNNETGGDYWLVKNSWGIAWGMEGYIMMSRNRSNNCGIATAANYPIV